MKPYVSVMTVLGVVLVLGSGTACTQKRQPLVPLVLEGEMKVQAIQFTEQGTQAYQARQFEVAKQYFEQAITVAPGSGQAHYNYALALNALGHADVARRHFMEAADLAPGDKTIWDSPALAPFGDPEPASGGSRYIERPHGTMRPGLGNMSGSNMPGGY